MPADPIEVEVFRHLFASVAEEMGVTLRRTALSPNIKERRDYSAAVFDADGRMVSQAAHLPVHLGSMPLSVRAAIDQVELEPGDEAILNDPYAGGTHLPDITVVRPVFVDEGGEDGAGRRTPSWYVANRAHHADVGGQRPGSMVLSDHIDHEGLRLAPQLLDDACVRRIVAAVRTPDERQGDLAAQRASNATGETRLRELTARHGAGRLTQRVAWLHQRGEAMMRSVISRVPDGAYAAEDWLDGDGLGSGPVRIAVRLTIDGEEAHVDFSESDGQVAGPMNSVFAITLSATVYCFRCIAPAELPGSDGYMRPIRITAPEGSIVNARYPAPVFGGNVETSQRIVDVVMRALQQALPGRVPAASCGSMNNVTFGGHDRASDRAFAYYETLAGGLGGGPEGPGASGLHSHMTNTLNTPIEALEHQFPVRIDRYALRRGSGGAGEHSGGEGIVREYRFLEPVQATVLTERRDRGPWGLGGAGEGAPGRNSVVRADGGERALPAKAAVDMKAGETLRIETPGGGGWNPGAG